jgi:glycosyltransferase involved in cell wall biosynthesis
MKPMGGTEILLANLKKRIEIPSNVNLIISNCDETHLDITKHNILWQHLNTNEAALAMLPETKDLYELIIFVSEWQRAKFVKEFDLDPKRCVVIKNAIEPIKFQPKPKTHVKLIYTSTPWRGLWPLMYAFRGIKKAELTVYSSTIIYGDHFNKLVGDHYAPLYDFCRATPACNYKGYALNAAVRNDLLNHHILAYPCVFEETSCLAAIEAGAAGCEIVTTNYGALPETCNKYRSAIEYDVSHPTEFIVNYRELLQEKIDNYDPSNAKNISDYFNDNYSWDVRISQWRDLFNNI